MDDDDYVDRVIKSGTDWGNEAMFVLSRIDRSGWPLFLEEELSPDWLTEIMDEAKTLEDYELCQMIAVVEAAYLERFTVSFRHPDHCNNIGRVAKFKKNGRFFYHVDYAFGGVEEGQLLMLYRQQSGQWHSDKAGCDRSLFRPIGIAINWHENWHDGFIT